MVSPPGDCPQPPTAAGSRHRCRRLPRPAARAITVRQVGRYFQVKDRKSRLSTELRAGVVTFLTACEPRARAGGCRERARHTLSPQQPAARPHSAPAVAAQAAWGLAVAGGGSGSGGRQLARGRLSLGRPNSRPPDRCAAARARRRPGASSKQRAKVRSLPAFMSLSPLVWLDAPQRLGRQAGISATATTTAPLLALTPARPSARSLTTRNQPPPPHNPYCKLSNFQTFKSPGYILAVNSAILADTGGP